MSLSLRWKGPAIVRPRVSPDPAAASKLLEKINSVSYQPSAGFHRDRKAERMPRMELFR